MQLKTFALTALLSTTRSALAFPRVKPEEFRRMVEEAASAPEPEIRDGQLGRIIQFDPVPAYIGTKKIPGELYRVRV